MVLVLWVIDDRGEALAEGVVQGVIDLLGRQAEAVGGGVVHRDVGLQRIGLLIGVDLGQRGRLLELLEQLVGPCVQGVEVVAGQGVLVFGVGRAAADADRPGRPAGRAGRRP